MGWALSVLKAAMSSNHFDWLDLLTNQLGVDPEPKTTGFGSAWPPALQNIWKRRHLFLDMLDEWLCLLFQHTDPRIKSQLSCWSTSF